MVETQQPETQKPDGYLDGEEAVVIDRGRLTHKQSKRATVIALALKRASDDGDADAMEALLDEMDAITGQVVVAVPAGWLPDGVKVGGDGWMDHLTQARYERLMELARPPEPGSPKA